MHLREQVTHLVVKPDDLTRFSGKIDKAWGRGVPVVSMRYFEKCLEKNELVRASLPTAKHRCSRCGAPASSRTLSIQAHGLSEPCRPEILGRCPLGSVRVSHISSIACVRGS